MNIPLDSPPVYATTYMAQSMAMNRHLNTKGDKRSHNGFNIDDAKPFLIGVAGGTASGKSSVCKKIVDELGMEGAEQQNVRVISLDSFYKELTDDEKFLAEKGQFDFDHPKAFDFELMSKTIKDLKEGYPVDVYKYNHITCSREYDNKVTIEHADVILVEGILVFYWEEIRNLFNMRLFVDADADTRLSRRVKRNMQQYKRPLDQILMQYLNFVKPAFEEFCLPTKKYADVIFPRGADNTVAVDVIVQHIKDILKYKGNEPPPRKRHASHEYIINF